VVSTGGITKRLGFSIGVGVIRTIDPIPDGPRTPALYWAYDEVDSGYAERPDFSWIEVSGIGTRLDGLGDDETRQVSLPTAFGPFRYYGQTYTQVSICSNGWVAPGTTTLTGYSNTALPSSSMPPMVAVSWDDLYPAVGNGVWYFHDAANHRFVVEYDSVAYYSPQTSWDKFELVIYDSTVATPTGDNILVAQYLTSNNYVSNTVGLQDPTLAIAIQCLYNGACHRGTAPLTANRAIKYTTLTPSSAVEVRPGPEPRVVIRAWPNPFRNTVALSLPANHAATSIGIYDNAGRLVRTLALPPGIRSAFWDGCDESGHAQTPGIYFYRISSAHEAGGKLILSR
jgi:hypothetical protein